MTDIEFEKHYDEAKRMLVSGHDQTYIELQFLEQGVDRETIRHILKKTGSIQKSDQRRRGIKLMISGLATVAVGVLFTLISYSSGSPVVYVLFGLITAGFITFAKGAIDMF